MNTTREFREWGHRLIDRIADYYDEIEQYPVKSQVAPGTILNLLPLHPPSGKESMNSIMEDFEKIIMPGITHWQSPHFHAFFPANASFPSILAEMLTAAIGAQCMIWETSPAAAELEERMMEWLKEATGLPASFDGVIQDTASTATLCALLTARERYSGYGINENGFTGMEKIRVYCSSETHSSIEKAVKIAGFGRKNLVKTRVDANFAMDTGHLSELIEKDLAAGNFPLCVVATIGTTGSVAVDPLEETGKICKKHGLWLHVDAAYAGSALILDEFRWMIRGIEYADSFVFNPHKWLFTNFDCSAYFVRDREALIRTFEILPEYLKTGSRGKVNDYRDWGIQLGRRFRALKLWFVIRSFGISGLRNMLRSHIHLAEEMEKWMAGSAHYEIMAPRLMNVICFRYHPREVSDPQELDVLNERFLKLLNKTGEVYLTHTRLNGRFTIRVVLGNTHIGEEHVQRLREVMNKTINRL